MDQYISIYVEQLLIKHSNGSMIIELLSRANGHLSWWFTILEVFLKLIYATMEDYISA